VFACGCDPYAVSTADGDCPLNMARKYGDEELLNAFYHTASLCTLLWQPCNPSAYDVASPIPLADRPSKKKSAGVLSRLSGDEPEERRSSTGVLLRTDVPSADVRSIASSSDVELGNNRFIGENEICVSAIYHDTRGYRRNLANPPKNNTDLGNLSVYAIFVCAIWLLTVVVPFWVWAIIVLVASYLYR
jgi:hypothetical protein